MLFPGDLTVLGGSIKADVSQVLLQQPQPVTGVIHLGGMVAVAFSPSKLR